MKFPRINIIFAADGIALSGLLPTKTQAFFRLLERYIHIQLPLFAHSQERIIYKQFPLILNLFSLRYFLLLFDRERNTHQKTWSLDFNLNPFSFHQKIILIDQLPDLPCRLDEIQDGDSISSKGGRVFSPLSFRVWHNYTRHGLVVPLGSRFSDGGGKKEKKGKEEYTRNVWKERNGSKGLGVIALITA